METLDLKRRSAPRTGTPLLTCLALAALVFVTLEPGEAFGGTAKKRPRHLKRQTGLASWYGPGFFDRRTASGERFDPGDMAAAHRTLPFGTRIRVTNLENGRRVVLRVNDRGPYKKGRVLDVTPIAAKRLGFQHIGVARVRIDVLKWPRPGARFGDARPASPRYGTLGSVTGGAGARWTSAHSPDATTRTKRAESAPATRA
jgi:rare lipoprotein A (peptidoglycan hydrolase)